ncbi:hypothetical protein [Bartonella quintana]|uniref:hypothetical protein n=1 Tax=Bartonella quintana TaxID=803 RepID=UPI0031589D3A
MSEQEQSSTVYTMKTERAGAKFIIKPRFIKQINRLCCAKNSKIPLIPSTATPSELIKALDKGYSYLKFFPAEAAEGIAFA